MKWNNEERNNLVKRNVIVENKTRKERFLASCVTK